MICFLICSADKAAAPALMSAKRERDDFRGMPSLSLPLSATLDLIYRFPLDGLDSSQRDKTKSLLYNLNRIIFHALYIISFSSLSRFTHRRSRAYYIKLSAAESKTVEDGLATSPNNSK